MHERLTVWANISISEPGKSVENERVIFGEATSKPNVKTVPPETRHPVQTPRKATRVLKNRHEHVVIVSKKSVF